MSLRLMQPSFASGEITPLLHARTDLARYSNALAKLENMIVLPEGGVTRRPGFWGMGDLSGTRKLIPFVYNTTDSVMLEFGDYTMRPWVNGTPGTAVATPYTRQDAKNLRYAQSGNVMILAHRDYPLQMLTRKSLTNWTLEPFEFDGGPWIPGDEVKEGARITVTPIDDDRLVRIESSEAGTFTSEMRWAKMKIEYAMSGGSQTLTAGPSDENNWKWSNAFEVRSSFNVCTATNGSDKWWSGTVRIERKLGRNGNWMTVREFVRGNTQQEGQIDFTVTETEKDVFYRAGLYRTGGTDADGDSMVVSVTAAGFVKSLTFILGAFAADGKSVEAVWDRSEYEADELPGSDDKIIGWWLSAWGRGAGSYPGAVAFYQDRLVLAGSARQPQTIWLSRVGDYRDFSTSDPIEDDDAITITLTARTSDGIHSLVAAGDLLAFTNAGEWKIAGAGDAGAISPKAVVAHQQSNVGSKAIQPLLVNGRVVFVQTHGTKVYALAYDLNTDAYAGSEISILSSHMFKGKEITDFAWQQIPDGLLWFALSDGTAATCTYNPEHETIGWARQELAGGTVEGVACIPGNRQTELWAVGLFNKQYRMLRLARREAEELFMDNGRSFTSLMQTLRITLNGENGSAFAAKKLISRLTVSAIRSETAWAAPADHGTEDTNWERRRKITWNYSGDLTDADVQLDSGFANDAAIQIRTSEGPLTIAAVVPLVTVGG